MTTDVPSEPRPAPRPEWAAPELDLSAYLDRIGHRDPVQPTGATLHALHRAHVATIPFENLDVVLGRGVSVDVDSVQAKLVDRRRGGYCYEHATLFAAVLERIGFSVERLLARVGDDEVRPRPRTHMALRVRADDGDWLADVGFGNALLEPIPWGETGPHPQGGWTYRMVRGNEDTWTVQEQGAEGWRTLYRLIEEPVHASDVVMANHFTSTHPSSPFVGQAVAVRKHDDVFVRLRGRTRTLVRADGSSDERDLTDEDVAALLRDDVGLPLDDAELARLQGTLPPAP